MDEKTYYVYILSCEGDRLYTGYTDDFERRMKSHCGGRAGARFTRSFKPVAVAQCWRVDDRSAAMKIESFIKKMTREMKQSLVASPDSLAGMLAADIGLDTPAIPCLNEPPVFGCVLQRPHNCD